MDFAACPQCGAFSPASSKECQECHAPLPEQTEPPAAIPAAPAASEPTPAPAAPAPSQPPAFDAAPEVLARVQQLEAAIAQKPSATALYLQLAQVYADAKRKDLAVRVVERCLAREPGNVYLRHKLAQLSGKPDAARAAPAAAPAAPASPRTTASFQAVHRPAGPPPRRLLGSLSRNQKLATAGGILAIGALVLLKLWLFPSTRLLVSGDFRAFAPAWSPSGGQLAFLIEDGRSTRIAIYDFAKGAHRVLGPATAWEAGSFSWSADGARLAWTGPGDEGEWQPSIFVADAEGGSPRRVAAGSAPKWAADGSLIAVCRPEMRLPVEGEEPLPLSEEDMGERYCRIDVASGEAQRLALAPRWGGALSGSYESVVFEQSHEPSAEGAAPSGQDDFEGLVDAVAAGRAKNVAEGSRDLSRELEARQYQSRREAARTEQRLPHAADVFVASLAGGQPVAVTSDRHSAFPSWTTDGSRILFATDGASGVEFCTMRPDGGDRQTVLSGVKGVDPYSVTVSRDGSQVFFVASVPGDEAMAKIMTGESPADLHVAAVGSKRVKRLANRHPFKQRYSVSPEGDRVAYEVLQDVKLIGGASKSELWLMRR